MSATGGINKDTKSELYSPHQYQHEEVSENTSILIIISDVSVTYILTYIQVYMHTYIYARTYASTPII